MQSLKDVVRQTRLYDVILHSRQRSEVRAWQKNGRVGPLPSLLKQALVKDYARRFSIRTFVETGTYLGTMVDATKDTFSRILSIELDQALYERAAKRFARYANVSILLGDSGDVLQDVLATVTVPCLFWLDAHFSGGITVRGNLDTPVLQELEHMLTHKVAEHVVLIDDADWLDFHAHVSIDQLRDLVQSYRPDWRFEVTADIVRVHP